MSNESSEAEDYMTMTFEDTPSSLLPQEERTEKQKWERGRTKNPAVLEEEHLHQGLSQNLFTRNSKSKAIKMMQSMGFKAEEGLGKHDSQPMLEPLTLERKNDKSGLGHVNERKRLLEELLVEEQQQSKKQVVEIETFEKHQRQVYSEKQTAKYLRGALSVLERLEEDKLEAQGKPLNETDCHPFLKTMIETRKAAEEERRKRIRRMNGLQSNSDSDDELSSQSPQYLSEDVPTSDDETPDTSVSKSPRTEFDTAEDSMKLNMLLNELRTKYLYCFWCGSKYTDKSDLEMNCPGLDEESH